MNKPLAYFVLALMVVVLATPQARAASFTANASMNNSHYCHSATMLPSSKALFSGNMIAAEDCLHSTMRKKPPIASPNSFFGPVTVNRTLQRQDSCLYEEQGSALPIQTVSPVHRQHQQLLVQYEFAF